MFLSRNEVWASIALHHIASQLLQQDYHFLLHYAYRRCLRYLPSY